MKHLWIYNSLSELGSYNVRGAFQNEYTIPCKLVTLQRSVMKLGEIKIFECPHTLKSLASVRSEHAY